MIIMKYSNISLLPFQAHELCRVPADVRTSLYFPLPTPGKNIDKYRTIFIQIFTALLEVVSLDVSSVF